MIELIISSLLYICPGHLTGKHERHFAVSGCPLYHNLSADECKVSILKKHLRFFYLDVLIIYFTCLSNFIGFDEDCQHCSLHSLDIVCIIFLLTLLHLATQHVCPSSSMIYFSLPDAIFLICIISAHTFLGCLHYGQFHWFYGYLISWSDTMV